MKISFELNTHGYQIGERVEFRPHCGRKATLTGTITAFAISPSTTSFTQSCEIKDQHALLIIQADDGLTYTAGSWTTEKCCHKIK